MSGVSVEPPDDYMSRAAGDFTGPLLQWKIAEQQDAAERG